ncbi:MAG TPA: sugar ABC transporter substrate-binding protein [Steroidobacteraceae bacterium]|nr:sugar ABC transporter substrate-binding protein [Steroidobacteraceae bacterium]
MVNRRQTVLALAAVAAAPLGCTRRSHGPDTVSFWAVGREGEVAADLIREFLRERPDIHVEVQKLPWTAAHEKLLTAYAGDTLPDLCSLGNTWIPEFMALNALTPLDSLVQASREIALDDYFPGILDSNRVEGRLYGIPWYIDTRLLYYRRDLLHQAGFDAPPTTWAEWERMLGAIKTLVGRDRYSILLPLNEFEPLLVLSLQQPSELLRDKGRYGNFRSDDFHRTLEFYASMFRRDWAPRMTNTQISNVWDEFGHGLFSFYISGPWNIAEFRKRLPPQLADAWMTAPMPGPNGPGASSAGGASLVIFNRSGSKPATWALMEYLSRSAVQQRFYELTGNMPPRRSTWQSSTLAASPYAKAYLEQLDRVRSPPKVPEWERLAQEMRLAAERVVQNVSTVDAACVALDRKTDEILEKRRWMMDKDRVT